MPIKTLNRRALILAATAALMSFASSPLAADPMAEAAAFVARTQESEAHAIAMEAYLYGYPRVELARRICNETRRVSPGQVIYAPPNRFHYFNRLARPGDGLVIKAPNNDTLYGSAYLDLANGPVLLRVPAMGDRYYVALLVDAAGAVVGRLSRTVSGPGGVDHGLVATGDTTALPADVRRIEVAGKDMWLLMRVATSGTAADERTAAALLRQFRLQPLANRAALAEPQPESPVASAPVVAKCDPLGKMEFFDVMARMVERNPVPAQDAGLLARWERIRLTPGRFDAASLSEPVRRGIERAIADAEQVITAAQFGIAITTNGWNYSLKIGQTGSDWALNAAIARGGYGNRPEDSVYYQRNQDAAGVQLSGDHRYTMTFPAGSEPPVGEFWSVTAYDKQTFDLIENPIRRYSIGDRTAGLKRNPDGSLTLALQRDPPRDPVLRANWLPIGSRQFYLVMRTYDPRPAIIEGKWAPPDMKTDP